MKIYTKGSIKEFIKSHADARTPLLDWHDFVLTLTWNKPSDVINEVSFSDILKGNRICFNIGGNKYRLIAKIEYKYKLVFIKFIGTHAEYSKLEDPNTIDMYKSKKEKKSKGNK